MIYSDGQGHFPLSQNFIPMRQLLIIINFLPIKKKEITSNLDIFLIREHGICLYDP